jgi:hypothetical protein
MRVALLTAGAAYPLAGEEGVAERVHSSAADWEHAASVAKQPMDLLRATYSHILDRGNLLTTVSFTTTRMFETASDAWLYDLDYDRTMPRSGTLVMEALNTSGLASIRHLLNAHVDPPRRRVTGCTVFLAYTVTGGEIIYISDAADPGGDALLSEGGDALLAEDGDILITEN